MMKTSSQDRVAAMLASLLLAVAVSSCQQVVNIDLNKANPQMVIEGIVSDQKNPPSVALSMSGNYFEPSLYFPPVTNASVFIADELGEVDTLKEVTSGNYQSARIQGTSGRTYSLRVLANGNEYDATSTMPQKVTIDSMFAVPRTESDGDHGYDLYVLFKDPPKMGNYYRLNIHVSVPISPDSIDGRRYHLYSDKLTNGNEAVYRVRMRRFVSARDTVKVDLLCIDKSAYDYFNTLDDILTSDRAPTALAPANPNTNLSNGALGYFAAWTVDTKTMILK